MLKTLSILINAWPVMVLVLSLSLTSHVQALPFSEAKLSEVKLSETKFSLSETNLKQALAQHQGQVVYLDFWASWCGPCRKSFPWMNDMQQKYREQGFTIISVNLDANKALAEKFLLENPANFSVIYDPKGDIAQRFKIKGMPSSLLIDRKGQVQQAHNGFFSHKVELYEAQLTAQLAIK